MNYLRITILTIAVSLSLVACQSHNQEAATNTQKVESPQTTTSLPPEIVVAAATDVSPETANAPTVPTSTASHNETTSENAHEIGASAPTVTQAVADLWKVAAPMQNFTVNAQTAQNLELEQGTVVEIPENAFVIAGSNEPVQGEVQLVAKEYRNKAECIAAGLTTMSDKGMLESGGMLYVDARFEGKKCALAKGKELTVSLPTWGEKKADMKLFTGARNSDGLVEWKEMEMQQARYVPESEATVTTTKRNKGNSSPTKTEPPARYAQTLIELENYKNDFNSFLLSSMNVETNRDVCANKMRNFIFPNKNLANFKPKQPVIYRLAPETELVLAEEEAEVPANYVKVTGKTYSALSIQLKMNSHFFNADIDARSSKLRFQDTKGPRIIQPEQTVCRVAVASNITGTVEKPKMQWTNMYLTNQMEQDILHYVNSREWQIKKKGAVTVEIYMDAKDAKRYQRFYPQNFSNEEQCMHVYAKPFQKYLAENNRLKKEDLKQQARDLRKYDKRYEKALAKSMGNTDGKSLANYIFRTGVLGWINCDRYLMQPMLPVLVDGGAMEEISATIIYRQYNSITFAHNVKYSNHPNMIEMDLAQNHDISLLVIKKVNGQQYYALEEVRTGVKTGKPQVFKITNFEPLTFDKLKELTNQFLDFAKEGESEG